MDDDGFKSSWNIAGGLAEQIDRLLGSAGDHYIEGKLHEAWKRLKAINQRIIQLLSPEQKQDLNKSSNKVCALTINTENPKIRELASKEYDNYNEKIMVILHEKGLLLQERKNTTRMKF